MKLSTLKRCKKLVYFIFHLYILLFCVSCTSIKPSTVQLSSEVGERISEMEKLHQTAIQRYFDMEKQKVEDFLTNTWEPLFLKNFIGTSQVLRLLQNVSKIDDKGQKILKEGIAIYLDDKSEAANAANDLVEKLTESRKSEDNVVRITLKRYIDDKKIDAAVIHISSLLGTDEPVRIIFEFAEAAHKEMDDQRKEMLAPIEQLRMEAVASLSGTYAELIRGQSTITGRLEASAKRSKQQDELLDKLKIKIPEDLINRMTNITTTVNGAISTAKELSKAEVDPAKILSSFKESFEKNSDSQKK